MKNTQEYRTEELRGWAGLFGRSAADEVRLAIDIHLLNLAVGALTDESERNRYLEEGMDVTSAEAQLRERLEVRHKDAYARPSTRSLIEVQVVRSAGDPIGFPGAAARHREAARGTRD